MNFQNICNELNLGNVLAFEPYAGGLINELWKVKTTQDHYAIKVMSQTLTRSADVYNAIEKMTGDLAQSHTGIITAYKNSHNNAVLKESGRWCLVYPWIDGKPIVNFNQEQAGIIAEHLAVIHNHQFTIQENEAHLKSTNMEVNLSRWENIKTLGAKQTWYPIFSEIYSSLTAASQRYNTRDSKLEKTIFTHADLTPLNVLWVTDKQPIIIDWEWASLRNATTDCLHIALLWSGIFENKFNEEFLKQFIKRYLAVGGNINYLEIEDALYGSLGIWLTWAAYNLEQSISSSNEAERQMRNAESYNTLRKIKLYLNEMKNWISIVQKML